MDTLETFAKADAQAMEDWLAARYSDLYGDDPVRQREACRLRAYGVDQPDSFLDGLTSLFASLPASAKPKFRQAVGSLLRHARPGEFPASAMKELVLLIGLTNAHDQVVAFEPVLGSGAWGESTPELFFCALAVLRGLKHGDASYQAQKRLLSSRNFPVDYVFDAYEVLLGAHPEAWHVDLLELAPAMLERERALRAGSDARALQELAERYDALAEDILESVAFERIADGLKALTQRTEHMAMSQPVGRIIAAFARGRLLARIEHDAESGAFRLRRADASLSTPLRELSAAGEIFIERQLANAERPAAEQPPRDATLRPAAQRIDAVRESIRSPRQELVDA